MASFYSKLTTIFQDKILRKRIFFTLFALVLFRVLSVIFWRYRFWDDQPKIYQLDFFIPVIFPSLASSRKQILQRPKSLMKPCPRPHLKQRFLALVENFGFLRGTYLRVWYWQRRFSHHFCRHSGGYTEFC